MKFSLEWLLNIRKNELNSIELELVEINTKISENTSSQEKNDLSISIFQRNLYTCTETWKIPSIIRSIESCEEANTLLQKELIYLMKDKEMIFNRYKQKHIEVKLLEKSKSNFITKEKIRISKKEEAEINQLSLIARKDE